MLSCFNVSFFFPSPKIFLSKHLFSVVVFEGMFTFIDFSLCPLLQTKYYCAYCIKIFLFFSHFYIIVFIWSLVLLICIAFFFFHCFFSFFTLQYCIGFAIHHGNTWFVLLSRLIFTKHFQFSRTPNLFPTSSFTHRQGAEQNFIYIRNFKPSLLIILKLFLFLFC